MTTLTAFLCFLIPLTLYAKDDRPLLVVSERIPIESKFISGSIATMESEEIEDSKVGHAFEALEQIPGLTFSKAGGPGGTTSSFIRGNDSGHTLVLIDGIEMNNAINPARSFDFAYTSLWDIKRFEVFKGSQSILYGSDAIGGVLTIETDKREGTEAKATYGSFKTFSVGGRHASTKDKLKYKFSIEHMGSEGINHTAVGDQTNAEKDGYNLTTFGAFLDYRFSDLSSLTYANRTVYNSGDIDKGFGTVRDDRNYTSTNLEVYNKLEYKTIWLDGLIEPKFSFSTNYFKRDDQDLVDSINTTKESFNSKGNLYKFSYENHLFPNESTKITAGLEHEKEIGSSDNINSFGRTILNEKKVDSFSAYAHMKNIVDPFFLSTGIRGDRHQWYGGHASYKISPGYYNKDHKLKVYYALSTGFKAPTITQLHSANGNRDLKPEESLHHEVGAEQGLENSLFGFSFFKTKIEEKIEFQNNTFLNVGESEITGKEVYAALKLPHSFKLRLGYTHLKTEIVSSGLQLINRPNSQASLSLSHKRDWMSHRFSLLYKGRRDGGFEGSRVALPSYITANLSGSYDLNQFYENWEVWWSLTNLLDKDFTDVAEINSPGRSTTLGAKKTF